MRILVWSAVHLLLTRPARLVLHLWMQESDLPSVVQPGTKVGGEDRLHVVDAGSRYLPILKFVVLEEMLLDIEHSNRLVVVPVLMVLAVIRKGV